MDLTAQLARDMKKQLKQVSRIDLWGSPLWNPGDLWYELEDVKLAGDALQLHLLLSPENERVVLEIVAAQSPKMVGERLEIAQAKLVRWKGQEQKPPASAKPPAVVVS